MNGKANAGGGGIYLPQGQAIQGKQIEANMVQLRVQLASSVYVPTVLRMLVDQKDIKPEEEIVNDAVNLSRFCADAFMFGLSQGQFRLPIKWVDESDTLAT